MHTHDFECTFYTRVDRDVSDNFFGATAWSFQNGFVIAIWKYILVNIKILDKIWQNQASNLLNSIWQAIKKLYPHAIVHLYSEKLTMVSYFQLYLPENIN